mgnify:CR=1 FL=1
MLIQIKLVFDKTIIFVIKIMTINIIITIIIIKTNILIISFKIVLIFLTIKMKMVLQMLLLIVFGQTDVANLTKANENAFAKAVQDEKRKD